LADHRGQHNTQHHPPNANKVFRVQQKVAAPSCPELFLLLSQKEGILCRTQPTHQVEQLLQWTREQIALKKNEPLIFINSQSLP